MAKLLENNIQSQVKGLVQIENLSVGFRRKGVFTSVLDDVNFTIQPGEFICLLGPSGCGKSTILNTVAGFIKPSTGNVLVDYHRITKPGADRGFVFQQYSLLPWKTTFQNVEFGLKVRGVLKQERKELVDYYLNRVGLSKYRHAFPYQLSGGMQQRASIIRALKSTVIFVTHDIEEAVFLSDRIFVMGVNPGHIKTMVDISLERPRHVDLMLTAEFMQLNRQVFDLIREETMKSMAFED
jgi:NitT/TauT family transport system ATP-binding protein